MNVKAGRVAVGLFACAAGAWAVVRQGFSIPALGAAGLALASAGAWTALRTVPRAVSLGAGLLAGGATAWLALGVHERLRGERPDVGPDPTVERASPDGVVPHDAWRLEDREGVLAYRATGPAGRVDARPGFAVRLENAGAGGGALPAGRPLRFAVWGDCRGGVSVFERLLEGIRERGPAFSVGIGDLVGMARTYQFEIVRDRLARTGAPAFVLPGNHDLDPFGTLRPYARVFGPRNWSFVAGGALFVGLDTARGVLDPADVDWVERTVAGRPASASRVLLFCHHPLWMPASRDEKPLPEDAATGRLRALCEREQAVVFCSHWHGYDERTVGRVLQITTGGAGARLEGEGPYHFVLVTLDADGLRHERVDLGGPESASPRLDRLLTFRDEGAYVARHDPAPVLACAVGAAAAIGGIGAGAFRRRARAA